MRALIAVVCALAVALGAAAPADAGKPRKGRAKCAKVVVKRGAKAGRKVCRKKRPARKAPARKPNAAFMRPVTPSESLAEVVGAKPIPRTEVTKRLWSYIKKNGLQDPKNKRMIKSDAALKAVFGGKAAVNMFEMTKLVSKHLE